MSHIQVPVGMMEQQPIPPPGPILTVELVSTTLSTSDTVKTINLTKGQDETQCSVFSTLCQTQYTLEDNTSSNAVRAKVIDNSGTAAVQFERQASAMSKKIECYVVEWGPDIAVQQIDWSMASAAETATASCTEVDLTKAFVIASWFGPGVDDINEHCIRTKFNSSTQLGFFKGGTSNSSTANGIAYIIEDTTDDHFTVQTFDGSANAVGDTDHAITSISMTASMVISSAATEEAAGGLFHAEYHAFLQADDNVRVTLENSSAKTRYWSGFVVTFVDGTTVERGVYAYTSDSVQEQKVTSVAITTVDEDRAIVNLVPKDSYNKISHNNSTDQIEGQVVARIRSGGSWIDLERRSSTTAFKTTAAWEVVQFALP